MNESILYEELAKLTSYIPVVKRPKTGIEAKMVIRKKGLFFKISDVYNIIVKLSEQEK